MEILADRSLVSTRESLAPGFGQSQRK